MGQIEGYGTSYKSHTYTFQDQVAAPSQVYYRLKQIDFDGAFEYSNVNTVRVGSNSQQLALSITEVYPNPVTNQVQITLKGSNAENVTLRLRSASGTVRQQRQVQVNGSETPVMLQGLGSLPAGTYILTAESQSNRAVKRIIKQ